MKINEIFYSIQGEGRWAGLPNIFIRTTGCNLRCSFCDTKYAYEDGKKMSIEEIVNEIQIFPCKHICITGGEPLLQEDISFFLNKVKMLDYDIKIDTNGTYPKRLKNLIDKNLVDYISMDIKAPKKKYNKLCGKKVNIRNIQESINIIKNFSKEYEFKTTIIPNLLEKEDIIFIVCTDPDIKENKVDEELAIVCNRFFDIYPTVLIEDFDGDRSIFSNSEQRFFSEIKHLID